MIRQGILGLLVLLAPLASALVAQGELPALGSADGLPIREVTVFKDGHAFVIHQGELRLDARGRAALTDLPDPVLGTFWPAVEGEGVRLRAVRAGERELDQDVTATSLAELVLANPGARVWLRERNGERYATRLAPKEPLRGDLLVLETDLGTRVLPFARVDEITFSDEGHVATAKQRRSQRVIELEFEGQGEGARVRAGMSYVQEGLRWIPSYRVSLDGQGKAVIEMRATLVNDLRDLEDCRVRLVVGVPSFEFKDYRDPIGLGQFLRQVLENPVFNNNPIASNFASNMFNGQTAGFDNDVVSRGAGAGGGGDTGLDAGVSDADGAANLFFYTLEHLSLRRGERMNVAVASFELPYEDLYTLDIPYQAPRAVVGIRNQAEADRWARLAAKPKVRHQIKIENGSGRPLTTAPALIMLEGRVIAQSMLRYTAPGASCRLPLTKVIDVRVDREDIETGQTADALRMHSREYHRIDLSGRISLLDLAGKPMTVEVTRWLVGRSDDQPAGGERVTLGQYEDVEEVLIDGDRPWSWYAWPNWWSYVNGLERFTWTVKLEPGKETTLNYHWYYYWR
ncbi:MAG: hypothetical protein H6807_09645 [Planctomycetes bacterium]|nr:hypothetical protein [Planctomycetota bacterium]